VRRWNQRCKNCPNYWMKNVGLTGVQTWPTLTIWFDERRVWKLRHEHVLENSRHKAIALANPVPSSGVPHPYHTHQHTPQYQRPSSVVVVVVVVHSSRSNRTSNMLDFQTTTTTKLAAGVVLRVFDLFSERPNSSESMHHHRTTVATHKVRTPTEVGMNEGLEWNFEKP
jgi:hypothetical protein